MLERGWRRSHLTDTIKEVQTLIPRIDEPQLVCLREDRGELIWGGPEKESEPESDDGKVQI
jgi:hypothetical protein